MAPKGPAYRGNAWLTALTPGETAVGARVGFSDGTAQAAPPKAFRVDMPAASSPGSTLVAEGSLDIDAPRSGEQTSRFVSFTVPAAGNIDVTVDWVSPLDNIGIERARQGAAIAGPARAGRSMLGPFDEA